MTDVQGYDVFCSHAGMDTAVVERIALRLKERGIRPWLDAWELVHGVPFQDELARAVGQTATCAVFVGQLGIAGWVTEERDLALSRARSDPAFRVFAVLLPGAPDPIDAVDLGFLGNRKWVDLRGGVDDIDELVAAVEGVVPAPSVAEEVRQEPPYPGLAAFGTDDAAWFFGREAEVQQLVEQLKVARFLAVIGPSGSGKSSLVRAGLLPALGGGRVPGSDAWTPLVLRPGSRPLAELAAGLARVSQNASRPLDPTAVLDRLRDPRALTLQARTAFGGTDDGALLLVVDQFEEAFTRCDDPDERSSFIAALTEAATDVDGRVRVIVTMRSDFYSSLAAHPELARQVAGHQHVVASMAAEQLRDAVAQPAYAAGASFEPGLLEEIVEDTVGRPGALPLLQHALRELWGVRVGDRLTHHGYQSIGGVEGALAARADEVYLSLAEQDRGLVRRWFTDAVQLVGDTAVSRPVERDRLLGAAPGDVDAQRADPTLDRRRELLDRLVAARLLSTGARADGVPVVELVHEALIDGWGRLRNWIAADRELLLWRQELTDATQRWEEGRRDRAYLYGGSRLAAALRRMGELSEPLPVREQRFLRDGVRWERRRVAERYAGQAAAGGLGTAAGLAAAFGVLVASRVGGAALMLLMLSFAPLGAALGVMIGAGVFLAHGRQPMGVIVTGLLGAVAGAIVHPAAVLVSTTSDVGPAEAVTGFALGAPLGLAVGATGRRRTRAAAALAGGLLALAAARGVGGVAGSWPAVLLAGAVLGAGVAAGFVAAHVEDDEVAWVWQEAS